MTPSRGAVKSSAAAYSMLDGAALSSVLSFDLVSLRGIGNRPITIGGKNRNCNTFQ